MNKSSIIYRIISNASSIIKRNARLLIGIVIGILVVVAYNFFYSEIEWHKAQKQHEKILIAQQEEKNASIRNSALINEMSSVVDQMHDELNRNPNRMLSDETIERIAALSYSFKPYFHVEGDSISSKKLSSERGQLLLIISGMKIDSGSLMKIMQQSVFSSASLKNADLKNAYLKGINLNEADLRGANLEGVNMDEADLRSANLWGTNLKYASLMFADLKFADLSWSDLNGATLKEAKFNNAILKSSQLRKTDMRSVVFQRADLSGALLNEANLQGANMLSVYLYRTNLSDANLRQVNLTTATLTEANLTGADLTGATFGSVVTPENWLTLLKEWKVLGATEIGTHYQLIADTVTLVPHHYLINRDK